jgi:hypothetical protein
VVLTHPGPAGGRARFRGSGLAWGGEIDTLVAPELAAFMIARLAVVPLVVLNLDGN